MMMVRVYDDYDSKALQAVDIDDLEGREFSKKFRAKSSGDMKKLMGCVGHLYHPVSYTHLTLPTICSV